MKIACVVMDETKKLQAFKNMKACRYKNILERSVRFLGSGKRIMDQLGGT
jgi:hypothetical protein